MIDETEELFIIDGTQGEPSFDSVHGLGNLQPKNLKSNSQHKTSSSTEKNIIPPKEKAKSKK